MADEQAENKEFVNNEVSESSAERSQRANEPKMREPRETPPRQDDGKFTNMSVRAALESAQKEVREKEEAAEKKALPRKEEPVKEEKPPVEKEPAKSLDKEPEVNAELKSTEDRPSKQEEKKPDDKPTAAAAPESWTKSERESWDKTPPEAQQAVLRREEESRRGVEQLKLRYAELEDAVTPYRASIRNAGRSEGQVVKALFEWNMELAHPDQNRKHAAFMQLAKNFHVDLAALTPNAVHSQQQGKVDAVPDYNVDAAVAPIRAELGATKQQLLEMQQRQQAADAEYARNTLAEFSKDRPYYDRVRDDMHALMRKDVMAVSAGLQPQYIGVDGKVDLQKLYDTACWMKTDIRAEIQQQERDKAEAEVKAKAKADATRRAKEAERAKEASSSVRSSAPGTPQINSGTEPRGESVRDSIRRAKAMVEGK